MILDALHTTLSNILRATPYIGEFEATPPLCVYTCETTPIKTKDGIIGYDQKIAVAIIDDDLDRLNTNSIAVISAITSLNGTIEQTTINQVQLDTESGPIYDTESRTWQNTLDFSMDTDNR